MFGAIKLLALTAVASAVNVLDLPRPMTQAQAGAFDLYLNTTSIQNLLQLFVPIQSYYVFTDKDWVLNVTHSTLLYTLSLDKIHTDGVQFNGQKTFEMTQGNDREVHIQLDGIDAQTLVYGSMKLLHFIPMDASAVNLTGVSINVTLAPIINNDMVHWKLKDTTGFTFDKMSIKMKNSFLQGLVNLSIGLINNMVKAELPKLGVFIDKKVQELNAALQAEETSPYAFAVNLFKNAAINLTMTEAPDLATQDLIKVYFNGLILNGEGKTRQSINGIMVPPRLEHDISEQIWIHQSMLNSLIEAAGGQLFPIIIDADSANFNLLAQFPEIAEHYGADVIAKLRVSVYDKTGLIKMSTDQGFVLGQDGTRWVVDILCTTDKVTNEVAATFEMNMVLEAQTNIFAFMVYPNIQAAGVQNAVLKTDNIGMNTHDYNDMFNKVFNGVAEQWNGQYNENGFPLGNIDPTIGLLSGLLQQFTVSPLKVDGFLLFGFSMY